MIDIFAWIVLLVLVASAIVIFFIAGSLPGHIAKSRGHPWATAVTVAGSVNVDLRLRPLADRADLGLCRHPRTAQGGGPTVIDAVFNVYLVLLIILVKMKIVPLNLFWKISPLCRNRGRCGDLHPAHQAGARYPQGHRAADRDIELRQPILRARKELWRGGRPLTETERVR